MPVCDALIAANNRTAPAIRTPSASLGACSTCALNQCAASTQEPQTAMPTTSAVAEHSPMILPARAGSEFLCPAI